MESDKVSILNYLPLSELTGDTEDQVDTCMGAPVRFLYFNTTESTKIQVQQQPHPDVEDNLGDDEKQRGRARQPDKWRQNMRKKNKNQGMLFGSM